MTAGKKAIVIIPPVVFAFAAAYFTYLAWVEESALRWVSCVCLWIGAAGSAGGAVARIRSQSKAGS